MGGAAVGVDLLSDCGPEGGAAVGSKESRGATPEDVYAEDIAGDAWRTGGATADATERLNPDMACGRATLLPWEDTLEFEKAQSNCCALPPATPRGPKGMRRPPDALCSALLGSCDEPGPMQEPELENMRPDTARDGAIPEVDVIFVPEGGKASKWLDTVTVSD